MGLAERRSVKLFQDDRYSTLKREIDTVAGFPVEMDVQWDTISTAAEGNAKYIEEALPKVYFRPLIEALKAVAVDDLGREALKTGLKKIVVRSSGTTELSFNAGILVLDHDPTANMDEVGDRKKQLQLALEKGL